MCTDIAATIAEVRTRVRAGDPLDSSTVMVVDDLLALLAARVTRTESVAIRRILIAARDAAIGRAATHFEGSVKNRAKHLASVAKNYAGTAWHRHRVCVTCPPESRPAQGELWNAMKGRSPRFPFGIRQMEKIISRSTSQVQVRTNSAMMSEDDGDADVPAVAA